MTDLLDGHPARYGVALDDGRVRCTLCPRDCTLAEGQRGFCFVRANEGGRLVLTTYGRSSGFAVDPVEKKPLHHFHPGSQVFSFGTVGCNLGCKFCQNADISKSRELDRLQDAATPTQIAGVALGVGARSVAVTYNEPLIFAEYAIDTATAVHEAGLSMIAVSDGYCHDAVRRDFFAVMDAANIDLKGFSDAFYQRITGGHLRPVLDTLTHLVHETDVWTEITTLVIEGHNDSDAELTALSRWVSDELGPDVPLHFSAFHPAHRMLDAPRTSMATLRRARDIARSAGLRHVYTGNVHDRDGDTTFCPDCGEALIVRDWYRILVNRIGASGECPRCGTEIAGRWD